MVPGDSLFQSIDNQLTALLSEGNIYTAVIALALGALIIYPLIYSKYPDTHPFLLARQCHVGQIRQPRESATYRARDTPHDFPLVSGLKVRDPDTPRWAAGRQGDLRDVWRRAMQGPVGTDGQSTGKRGRMLTILGKDEVIAHDLGQSINGEEFN